MQRAEFGGRTGGPADRRPGRGGQPAAAPGGRATVGVVVGATVFEAPDLSALGGPVLVPGIGAQGGRPEALAGWVGPRPGQLLPAVSREVLRAGPDVAELRAAGRADARRRRLPGGLTVDDRGATRATRHEHP